MERDRFDDMIVNIENKTFEINMLISAFAVEILLIFEEGRLEVVAEIAYNDYEAAGLQSLETEAVYFNVEDELVYVSISGRESDLLWDDLDLSSRDILINEMHCKYKSELLFRQLNSGESDLH